MPSAVIVRAHLPAGLERLRRTSVEDAGAGLPAHLTLLYPFIEPEDLGPGVRQTLTRIASRHAPFDFRQVRQAAWPDTIYVEVAPEAPFTRLQRDLQAAFAEYPIYGRDASFRFVPHVTIAEGGAVGDPAIRSERAWRALPRTGRAAAIELIATDAAGRWRVVWRIPLGGRGPSGRAAARRATADRMRP